MTQILSFPKRPARAASVRTPPRPRSTRRGPEPFDRDYWLSHCEGYRVDSGDGRLGFVEDVRRPPTSSADGILAVRAGRLGRRLLLVSTAEVAFVVPRAKRIWLRSPVAITGSEAA